MFTENAQENYTVSNEGNGFLPLSSLPRGPAGGFSFVNRIQQGVRGLLCEQQLHVRLWVQPILRIKRCVIFSRAVSTSGATYLVTMACVRPYIRLYLTEGLPPPVKGKFFDTRFGLINVQTGEKKFFFSKIFSKKFFCRPFHRIS